MTGSDAKKMETILVVTNTAKTSLFFKKTFENEYYVVECNNLAMINDILESTQINIIFIDEPSIDQSVHSVCQNIRHIKENTPILIITHHLKRSYVLSLKQSGASGFVSIPLDEEDVREKIRQLNKQSTKEKTTLLTNKLQTIPKPGFSQINKAIAPPPTKDPGFNKDATSLLLLEIDYFEDLSMNIDNLDMKQLLMQVSESIQTNLRSHDTIKLMDEGKFLITLVKTSKQAAIFIAENIKEEIQNTSYKVSKGSLQLTVSIGLVTEESHIKSDRLIDLAKKRLDQAKQEGNKIINH